MLYHQQKIIDNISLKLLRNLPSSAPTGALASQSTSIPSNISHRLCVISTGCLIFLQPASKVSPFKRLFL